MELVLLESSGMPERSVISINSRPTRQTMLSGQCLPAEPFKLRKWPWPLRIDVYSRLGKSLPEASLAMVDADGCCKVPFVSYDDRPMSVTFRVDTNISAEAKPDREEMDSSVNEYFSKTGVSDFIRENFDLLIQQQPDDPFTFLAKRFREAAAREAGRELDDVPVLKNDLREYRATHGPDAVRRRARFVLKNGIRDSRLEKILDKQSQNTAVDMPISMGLSKITEDDEECSRPGTTIESEEKFEKAAHVQAAPQGSLKQQAEVDSNPQSKSVQFDPTSFTSQPYDGSQAASGAAAQAVESDSSAAERSAEYEKIKAAGQAAAERAAAQAVAEGAAAEKAAADRAVADQAAADRSAADRAAAEKAVADRAAADQAANQAELERWAAEKAAAEKVVAEAAKQVEAARSAAERSLAEKAAVDRVAVEAAYSAPPPPQELPRPVAREEDTSDASKSLNPSIAADTFVGRQQGDGAGTEAAAAELAVKEEAPAEAAGAFSPADLAPFTTAVSETGEYAVDAPLKTVGAETGAYAAEAPPILPSQPPGIVTDDSPTQAKATYAPPPPPQEMPRHQAEDVSATDVLKASIPSPESQTYQGRQVDDSAATEAAATQSAAYEKAVAQAATNFSQDEISAVKSTATEIIAAAKGDAEKDASVDAWAGGSLIFDTPLDLEPESGGNVIFDTPLDLGPEPNEANAGYNYGVMRSAEYTPLAPGLGPPGSEHDIAGVGPYLGRDGARVPGYGPGLDPVASEEMLRKISYNEDLLRRMKEEALQYINQPQQGPHWHQTLPPVHERSDSPRLSRFVPGSGEASTADTPRLSTFQPDVPDFLKSYDSGPISLADDDSPRMSKFVPSLVNGAMKDVWPSLTPSDGTPRLTDMVPSLDETPRLSTMVPMHMQAVPASSSAARFAHFESGGHGAAERCVPATEETPRLSQFMPGNKQVSDGTPRLSGFMPVEQSRNLRPVSANMSQFMPAEFSAAGPSRRAMPFQVSDDTPRLSGFMPGEQSHDERPVSANMSQFMPAELSNSTRVGTVPECTPRMTQFVPQ